MKKRTGMVYIAIIALISAFAVISGHSQEDVTTVQDSAFKNRMRPAVPFRHDEHNEKAGIDECNVCHHVYQDGEKLEDESSEDVECSECHMSNNKADEISLIHIYHLNCKGCHQRVKAGPVMCGECHIKNVSA